MNRIKHIICVLCFGIIFPASVNAASLDIDSMQLCQSCHGADLEGNKMLGAPSISGMQEWYLYRQMKNYQKGLRGIHSEDLSGQVMRMSILNFDDANTSATRSRRALGFIFYGESAKEDSDAHVAYQRQLRQEMIVEGRI